MPIPELADQLFLLATESIRFIWMPVGIWTLLAGLFYFLLRYTPDNRPIFKYQAATALLWSLPLGILMAFLLPLSVSAPESWQIAAGTAAFSETASPSTDLRPVSESVWQMQHGVGLLTLLLAGMGIWNLAGISGEAVRIFRVGKSIGGKPLADVNPNVDALRSDWGIAKPVQVVFSSEDHAPMTFGWRRPIIVLPDSLQQQPEALRLTLVHELSHIRHRDYVRRLIEQTVQGLFFFHPMVSLLTQRIDQYREMACDNEVLQHSSASAREYATLLLNFAQTQPIKARLSISMADTESNLKKRIKAMKEYRFFTPGALNSTTIGLALAAVLLAVSALMVACEVKFVEDNSVTIIEAPEQQEVEAEGPAIAPRAPLPPVAPQNSGEEVFMIVENMPELIGGLASIQSNIKYPDIAKKAGIEGRVFVQFVVDENGKVQDPLVVRGIGAGCDEEAVRAVQLAKFKPGTQRGKAVKVKMSIPITFKLKDDSNIQSTKAEMKQRLEALEKMLAELKEKAKAVNEAGEAEAAKRLKTSAEEISAEIDRLRAKLEASS